jgi:hypothetical protein
MNYRADICNFVTMSKCLSCRRRHHHILHIVCAMEFVTLSLFVVSRVCIVLLFLSTMFKPLFCRMPSFGMLRLVDLVRTDVSDESIASFTG